MRATPPWPCLTIREKALRHEMVQTELGGTPPPPPGGTPPPPPGLVSAQTLALGFLPSRVPSLGMQPRPAGVFFIGQAPVLWRLWGLFPPCRGDRRPREFPPLQVPSPPSFPQMQGDAERRWFQHPHRGSFAAHFTDEEDRAEQAAVGFPSASSSSPSSRLHTGRWGERI